jgi:hypothetical protein
LSVGRNYLAGAKSGTQTAAAAFGGYQPPGNTGSTLTEEFNQFGPSTATIETT